VGIALGAPLGRLHLLCEDLLQIVGRFSTESTCHGAQQIKIYGALRTSVRRLRVHNVLGTACKTLHRNKVLAPDDAKIRTHERNFHNSRGNVRIHSTEPT
jgi:hypothetical protein